MSTREFCAYHSTSTAHRLKAAGSLFCGVLYWHTTPVEEECLFSFLSGRLRMSLAASSLAAAIRTVLSGPVSSLSHQRPSTWAGLWILPHKWETGALQMPLCLLVTSKSKMGSRNVGVSLAMGTLATAIRTILFGSMAFESHQGRSAQAHISAQATWP